MRDYIILPSERVPAEAVMACVRGRYGLSNTELKSKRRCGVYSEARHEACYRLRAHSRLSWGQVGNILRIDHSSAIYGANKYAERHGLPMP